MNVGVGFAPPKPAEFVVVRIGLKAAREDPGPLGERSAPLRYGVMECSRRATERSVI